MKAFSFKFCFIGFRIVVSADEISEVVVISSDPEEDWLESEFTHQEEHLMQVFLKLRIFGFLVGHRLDYCLVVTVHSHSLALPQMAPQLG